MLVLSRKRDERILIGTDIEIRIVAIRGDTVRVGIDAPKEIPIHRPEVLLRAPDLAKLHGRQADEPAA